MTPSVRKCKEANMGDMGACLYVPINSHASGFLDLVKVDYVSNDTGTTVTKNEVEMKLRNGLPSESL